MSSNVKSVHLMVAMLDVFRKFVGSNEVPTQQILTFLHVADRGEMPQADLLALAGIEQSSMSRTVARLGKGPNPDQPGFGLVERNEDPYYRRRNLITLTARGKVLVGLMDEAAARVINRKARTA